MVGKQVKRFRLAPMSPLIRGLTLLLLALPALFFVIAASGNRLLSLPGLLLIMIYTWIWLRFRPSAFIVDAHAMEIVWPLKRRRIPRAEISAARAIEPGELMREIGWGARVGAGGLWGAFGWLWTRRRGIVQMYVSRTDGYVWIERGDARPWLVTPEQPEAFVQALKS